MYNGVKKTVKKCTGYARRCLRAIIILEKIALILIVFALTAGGLFKMTARNFLTTSWAIQFSDVISTITPHFVLILGFYAASVGLSRGEVLKIDFTRFLLSSSSIGIVRKFANLVSAGILVIFFYLAIQTAELGEKIWIAAGYTPVLMLLAVKFMAGLFFENE